MKTQDATSKSGTSRVPMEQIEDEHRALSEALGRLEKTTDPHALLPRLEKLRDQLEHHFESEEKGSGIRDEVSRNAPYLLGSLQRVFDEHRKFLDDVDALHERTTALVEGPLHEILGEVTALGRRLRDHEMRETELLGDVYLTDYGVGAD